MELPLVSEKWTHFVVHLIDVIGSGRLGFDDTVREYVEMQPGTIATALQNYVKALNAIGSRPDSEVAMKDARRNEQRPNIKKDRLSAILFCSRGERKMLPPFRSTSCGRCELNTLK